MAVIAQAVAVGGALLIAFLMAWSFDRAFALRAVKVLLAVPTPRWVTITAKLLVESGLATVVALWAFVLGLAMGMVIALPSASHTLIAVAAARTGLTALLTVLLMTPVTLVACGGRGCMAPIGFAILAMLLAQLMAATGWGPWFCWSVPPLHSGLAGPESMALPACSSVLIVLTSAGGVIATLAWWRMADQTT